MNGLGHRNGAIEVAELWRRLEELEEGSLDPAEREELMTLLDRSPAARRLYLQYFELAVDLEVEAKTLGEQGKLPILENALRPWRTFRRSVMAAAAVLVVLGVIAAFIMIKQPEPGTLTAAVAADTRWMVDGDVQEPGSDELAVEEGSTVRVFSGTVKLRLESGSVMVMQGPAHAAFPELERPVLKSGWLWIDSGTSEERFEVVTPNLLIRDVGTRFGVRVPEKGAAEIHLIDGVVEVLSRSTMKQIAVLKPQEKGLAIPKLGRRSELPLARDPFPKLPELLAARPTYATTVLSQAPVGYWRLEEQALGEAANEISDGSVGRHALEVTVGETGLGEADGFHGFEQDNLAVFLHGESERALLYELDSPGGVSRKEGAVSFWTRRLPGKEREEVLWLAGVEGSGGFGPEDSMHAHLTASGRVQFFMENGKFDVLLSSTRSIVDGNWHHVAASWGPTAVDLYVDGKRTAQDDDFRILQEGVFSGRYVRFGKPSAMMSGRRVQPFTGWVDEIALWNRPLTAAEVWHQFQSARGNQPD